MQNNDLPFYRNTSQESHGKFIREALWRRGMARFCGKTSYGPENKGPQSVPTVCLMSCYSDLSWWEKILYYKDVKMSATASQITSLRTVYSTVYSSTDEKKTCKVRVTGLYEGNSPVTGEFPAQRASNAENVSIGDVIMIYNGFSHLNTGCTKDQNNSENIRVLPLT